MSEKTERREVVSRETWKLVAAHFKADQARARERVLDGRSIRRRVRAGVERHKTGEPRLGWTIAAAFSGGWDRSQG